MVTTTCATLQVTSAFLGTFQYEMSQKHLKLIIILHTFGISRVTNFERNGIPSRVMVGHWKGFKWLLMNI